MDPRVAVLEEAAQDEALGAEGIRNERMGGHGEAAGVVDRDDRVAKRAIGRDRTVDEEREQVTATGRDLLADDDLGPKARGRAPSTEPRRPRRSSRDR